MPGSSGRQMGSDLTSAVDDLVGPLRGRFEERQLSRAQLALRLRCDRSRVSRMLSGREVPALHLVEGAAGVLGVDVAETRRRWHEVDRIRSHARLRRADGWPPEGIDDYAGLLTALRELAQGCGMSHREVVRRDPGHTLRRSTVGAALRGQRSASREVVIGIVRACGVVDPVCVAAWEAMWWRLGYPHQIEQHRRQVDGLGRRNYAWAMMQSRWQA